MHRISQDSFIFVFGDHGFNYPEYLQMGELGRKEASLPLLAIRPPINFNKTFPRASKMLKSNSDSLVTWFDINIMLSDIIRNNIEQNKDIPQANTRGISPFQLIPKRTCEEAFIPEQYCACDKGK